MSVRDAKILKIVPNALTIGNSLCGFFAILYTQRACENNDIGDMLKVFVMGAWMIFAAMIFDALDGLAARTFRATSMTGIQMDSLSDMVTFGVAPAILVASMTRCLCNYSPGSWQELIVYAFCSLYLGCAALRLAIYNVKAITEHKNSKSFSGLPSPGAAAAICVTIFFVYSLSSRETSRVDHCWVAFILPVYAAMLGMLMVSRVSYLHAGKWLISMFRNRKKQLVFGVLLLLVIIFEIDALAALVTGYILSGPLSLLLSKKMRRKIFED
jgi:CDP-diacylglycerol--serine O-phosphatidyltransferase